MGKFADDLYDPKYQRPIMNLLMKSENVRNPSDSKMFGLSSIIFGKLQN